MRPLFAHTWNSLSKHERHHVGVVTTVVLKMVSIPWKIPLDGLVSLDLSDHVYIRTRQREEM